MVQHGTPATVSHILHIYIFHEGIAVFEQHHHRPNCYPALSSFVNTTTRSDRGDGAAIYLPTATLKNQETEEHPKLLLYVCFAMSFLVLQLIKLVYLRFKGAVKPFYHYKADPIYISIVCILHCYAIRKCNLFV